MKRLLAIDGNSVVNRAYYGIKLLSTKGGEYTNGIYGFLTILLRLLHEVDPDEIAVCFDRREPTFRHERYEGYKATRKGMPDELAQQMGPLKELLAALGFHTVELAGYEADDLMGTLARAAGEAGEECVIATGDRDAFQLIGEGTTVRLAYTKGGQPQAEIYDEDAIFEKYGVTPPQLIDIKALMGDSSDNVPGVPGVGEKTAMKLIQDHGSLDAIYERLDALDIRDSLREKLRANRELALLSRELVTIDRNAPIDTDPAHYRREKIDHAAAWALMTRLEMFSLLERFGVKQPTDLPAPGADGAAPEELQIRFNELPDGLLEAGEPVDLLFEVDEGRYEITAFCVIRPDALYLFDRDAAGTARRVLESPAPKRTNLLKSLHRAALREGYEIQNVIFDAEIAAYILNPNSSDYGIERLSQEYHTPSMRIAELFGELGALLEQCARFPALADLLGEKLRENGQEHLFFDIELPLARVLADMEHLGFTVDADGLEAFGKRMDVEIERYQKQVWADAGEEFNINSPKQLGVILFDKLGLPAKKKTKTGYSTNADVLEALRDKHPIIGGILEYRKVAKLKSTYVDGLIAQIEGDGRIHTVFQQTLTRTGRISSTEPNLQNIPIRTELGSELRRFFTAAPGKLLLDADYSQIELRVLAHVAGDENMIEAFQNNEDIHTRTAAQVFDMPPELVTSRMRSQAKAVNFGIVYGIGAFSLAQDIGVSVSEADKYIKGYLETFSGVRRYMEETVRFGTEHGYIQTLHGRRRYLPELGSSNRNLREFGKRVAMNAPIQGSAADIIKVAMVRAWQNLKDAGLEARLILQVHDELIVECPEGEAEQAAALLRRAMEEAAELSVPLTADVGSGANWLEAK